MSEFVSRPPSEESVGPRGFFQGGMMPAAPRDVAALIIIDIRSLNLSAEAGRELEGRIRDTIFEHLESHPDVDLSNRSALDLSNSVFGIAVE